ncbi:MAG: hypothetical protein KDE27_02705 [Planctomycetes bacterium]|nr:hypothetical protein [Planctomycetota bacterium]
MTRLRIGVALVALAIAAVAVSSGWCRGTGIRLVAPVEVALYAGRAPEPAIRLESVADAPVAITDVVCEPSWLSADVVLRDSGGGELHSRLRPGGAGLVQLAADAPPAAPGRLTAQVRLACGDGDVAVTVPLRLRLGLHVTPARIEAGLPRPGQTVPFACSVRCDHATSLRVRATGAELVRAGAFRVPAAEGARRWLVRGELSPLPAAVDGTPVRVWIEAVDSDAANYVEVGLGSSESTWVARDDVPDLPFPGFFFGLSPLATGPELGARLALPAAAFRAGGAVEFSGLGEMRSRIRWRVEPIDEITCRLVLTVPADGPAGVFSGRVDLRGPRSYQRGSFPVSLARGFPGRDFAVVPLAAGRER